MHERIEWIDVAKALGIIAVVVGHILPSGLTTQLIYWWHMPMFFIIGGFFLKPINRRQIGHFIKRRIQPQLATYFAVGLLLVLLSRAVHQTDWSGHNPATSQSADWWPDAHWLYDNDVVHQRLCAHFTDGGHYHFNDSKATMAPHYRGRRPALGLHL
ncbi:acyltransferase family protein [Secundilactobacillus kimchicus]|nr:acyltransferase family protein [Secundilactobacillus kimchicus]